jgi:uncharacterized protein YodC (DUF2158 family)
MEPTEFAVGSTVMLRSGGPELTVLGTSGDKVHCVFFSEELGEFREAVLPAAALDPQQDARGSDDEDDDEADDEAYESGSEDDEDDDSASRAKRKKAA